MSVGNGDPKAFDERMAMLMQKIADDIEREGWSAIGVFPTEKDPGVPFTYTIGLRDTYDHPELILFGMDSHQAHAVIGGAIERIKEGLPFKAGQIRNDVLAAGYLIKIHEVPEPGKPLNMARHFHNRDEAALQLVWPDQAGRFPGDEHYDVNFPQPLADGRWD